MSRIFVNLPVTDVAASTAFYQAIGFTLDPRFSNADASAMQWSEEIVFMLLSHAFYATFTDKPIADTRATIAVALCLSMDSREGVDAMTAQAVAAGGRETRPPMDQGVMFGRTFEDLDGHVLEPLWMESAEAVAATVA